MNYDDINMEGLQSRILTQRHIQSVKARSDSGVKPARREGLIHEMLVNVVWSVIEIMAIIIVTLVIMDMLKDLDFVHFTGLLTGGSILVLINIAIMKLTLMYYNGEAVKFIYAALVLRIGVDIYFVIEFEVWEEMDLGFIFFFTILYALFCVYRAYQKEQTF